ncbi:MAG: hypothetical protein R3A79_30010 [Nannocystaceae bacterium]
MSYADLLLFPLRAPSHHTRVTIVAGNEHEFFSVDVEGRVLRWRESADGHGFAPEVWRLEGPAVALLWVGREHVTWIEEPRGRVLRAPIAAPDDVVVIGQVQEAIAMRWDPDASELFVATRVGSIWGLAPDGAATEASGSGLVHAGAGWRARLISEPPSFETTHLAHLRADGAALLRGVAGRKVFVAFPPLGAARSTKADAHAWPDWSERPFVVDLAAASVRAVSLKSDRGKDVAPLPTDDGAAPDGCYGPPAMEGSGRLVLSLCYAEGRPSRLAVVDLERGATVSAEYPESVATKLATVGRRVVGTDGERLFGADATASPMSVEVLATVEATTLPEVPAFAEGVVAAGTTASHALLLARDGTLTTVDFTTREVQVRGVVPIDGVAPRRCDGRLYLVSDDMGDLLILADHARFAVFDLETRALLWTDHAPRNLLHEGVAGVEVDDAHMRRWDIRARAVDDAVVARPSRPAWVVRSHAHGARLFDPRGRYRGTIPGHDRTTFVDPMGAWLFQVARERATFWRLREDEGDREPGAREVRDDAACGEVRTLERDAPPSPALPSLAEGSAPPPLPVIEVAVADDATHHAEVTAVAADRFGFSGDASGRILRWDEVDGAPVAAVFALERAPAVAVGGLDEVCAVGAIATEGDRVVWFEHPNHPLPNTALRPPRVVTHGSPAGSAQSRKRPDPYRPRGVLYVEVAGQRTRVASLPFVHALRFADDGALLVSCDASFTPGARAPRGWGGTASVALRLTWAGGAKAATSKKRAKVSKKSAPKKVKAGSSGAPPAPPTLIELHDVFDAALVVDRHALDGARLRLRASGTFDELLPGFVDVADLSETELARRLERGFSRAEVVRVAARAAHPIAPAPEAAPGSAITFAGATPTHVWMQRGAEVVRVGFDAPEVEAVGVVPKVGDDPAFLVVPHPAGDVLVFHHTFGDAAVAYDVTTRAGLWRLTFDDLMRELVREGGAFGIRRGGAALFALARPSRAPGPRAGGGLAGDPARARSGRRGRSRGSRAPLPRHRGPPLRRPRGAERRRGGLARGDLRPLDVSGGRGAPGAAPPSRPYAERVGRVSACVSTPARAC